MGLFAQSIVGDRIRNYRTLVNSGENVSAGNLREEPEADVQFDQAFDMELSWFSNEARFILPVTVTGSDVSVLEGYVEFMACDDEQCLPPDRVDFSFVLDETGEPAENVSEASGADKEEGTEADVASKDEGEVANKTGKEDQSETRGNWTIFWLSFLGGFAALLTPCVFPMIPMTVSFFTKQSKTKASGFRNAIFYGVSIIVIYVILGTVVTAVFGQRLGECSR
jgi:thiol:disulfide interchange protein DsbD